MREDFSPNFDDKELALASRQHIVLHFLLHKSIFDHKQHHCDPPLTLLFSGFLTEDKTEWPQLTQLS
jgi:hypothetical protein